VTLRRKARIVEEEKASIARLQQPKQSAVAKEWFCKNVSTATESRDRSIY
jgi:hypothetical protein